MSKTHTPQAEQDALPPASKPYANQELVEPGSIDALTAETKSHPSGTPMPSDDADASP